MYLSNLFLMTTRPGTDLGRPVPGLRLFVFRPGLVNRLVQIEKSRGVGGIEWIMSRRFLIRSVQSDVDATVLSQNNHVQVAQNLLPLFVGQLRIGIDEILNLVLAEHMLFAHCLRINVRLGNTLLDEESLGA